MEDRFSEIMERYYEEHSAVTINTNTGTISAPVTEMHARSEDADELYVNTVSGTWREFPWTPFTEMSASANDTDEIKEILCDICELLSLMYDRDGPRVKSLGGIRAFIDSIKVTEEGGRK